jgi:hypothetical protein
MVALCVAVTLDSLGFASKVVPETKGRPLRRTRNRLPDRKRSSSSCCRQLIGLRRSQAKAGQRYSFPVSRAVHRGRLPVAKNERRQPRALDSKQSSNPNRGRGEPLIATRKGNHANRD